MRFLTMAVAGAAEVVGKAIDDSTNATKKKSTETVAITEKTVVVEATPKKSVQQEAAEKAAARLARLQPMFNSALKAASEAEKLRKMAADKQARLQEAKHGPDANKRFK